MSPRAWKRTLAHSALRDTLDPPFPTPHPPRHQASSVIICEYSWQLVGLGCVPKKGPCPQEGWGKKVTLRLGLKFSLAFGEFSGGITLAHLLSTDHLKPWPNLFTHLHQPNIYRINMKFFLKFEELFFNVVLDLGNRNMVVFFTSVSLQTTLLGLSRNCF